MKFLDDSPVVWLNRPYFNLEYPREGAFHIYGIEFTYRKLIGDNEITHNIQVVNSPYFRECLLRETGMLQYHVNSPLELDEELRTERWNILCQYLTNFKVLQYDTKCKVVSLLESLCFHQTIVDYVSKVSTEEIANNATHAKLALSRAVSNMLINLEKGTFNDLDEFIVVANHAASGTTSRLSAALQIVVQYAKTFRNLEGAEFWRTVASKEIEILKPSLNDFSYKLLMSIYYRAIVFVPLLQGDREQVVQEMNLCESYARSLIGENEVEKIVAQENRNIVLESRTKEALWLRDIDLAEERAQQLTKLDPFDPRYHLELGEILIKQNKIEEAAKMYRSAARLGPPGTAIAWFMAGQCHEKLVELDIACDCYLASLRIDELGISAVERLNMLAPRLSNPALASWSNMRLPQLQEQQKSFANQPRTSYIPEASSKLKLAGERALTQV